jgi:inner membrane protein
MDNLCHTLVGAAIGEAGLKRHVRHGNAVLMIASNLPDVDVLAFVTSTPAVALRRGWTHGVVAQLLLPVVLTAIVLAVERRKTSPVTSPSRSRAVPLLLLSYIGVIVHVLMDWLNNYGVRLLMPFSNRWFYGDSVFIVDPWLWLALGVGVLVARRIGYPGAARISLAVSALYIAGMIGSATAARAQVVNGWRTAHGGEPLKVMVGPVFANPLRKSVIVDEGESYRRGSFVWWPPTIAFDRDGVPKNEDHPAAIRARQDPDVRAVLRWARFPYYTIVPDPEGSRVTLRDMRFGIRVGSVTVMASDR